MTLIRLGEIIQTDLLNGSKRGKSLWQQLLSNVDGVWILSIIKASSFSTALRMRFFYKEATLVCIILATRKIFQSGILWRFCLQIKKIVGRFYFRNHINSFKKVGSE